MDKNKLLIKSGRVIEPATGGDDVADILVEDGKIKKIAKDIQTQSQTIIDAKGKIVLPGLVDMHVHLRQPGREDKETILTGTKAALAGGITSILAMPNTTPVVDSKETVNLVKEIIDREACANVYISAAITKKQASGELTDIDSLKKNGVIAITDDGSSVDSDELMLAVFKKAKKRGVLVICHSEDKSLSKDGVINAGFIATKLGLKGISKESEYKRIQRDIDLAKKAGSAVHIAHVSCKESVEAIEAAKKKGIKVTVETAPHYFSLTESSVQGYDTNMKMNPPLRTEEDKKAIKKALSCGIIDVIASDHAPHTENEKDIEFDRAAFGVIGLETELAVSITELVDKGVLSWLDLAKKMSYNPAKILGLGAGTLKKGSIADIVIIDADKEWVPKRESFVSKSKNSCFLGKKLKGVVEYTIKDGKVVYSTS
jgi:dihydroorotase